MCHVSSRWLLVTSLVVFAGSAVPGQGGQPTPTSPRLVLQITVDQLRGDLPGRYYERFGEGGFRYLMEHGYRPPNPVVKMPD